VILARAGTTRARSLMRQVEARQFGSRRPQPGSKWRWSGPGFNKAVSVERHSVWKEQLLAPLSLFE